MIRRRLVTIPRTVFAWVALTLSLPLLLLVAAVIDIARQLISRKPWVGTRLVLIAWVYLAAQVGVITFAGVQWLVSLVFGSQAAAKRRDWSYALQSWWVDTIMASMSGLFRLEFIVNGAEEVAPGPIIVLFRHVSIMDNLLPHVFVSKPNGIRLRWVLKQELLSDPALDIGGNRMPNYFVDRASDDPATERDNIAALADGIDANGGILLFPEGTRFSAERREKRMRRLAERDPELHDLLVGHDQVLPPRTGGVLALLDRGMDVVVGAHGGFEDLRGIKEIWSRAPVGKTITLTFRRFPAGSIPTDPTEQKRWLYATWAWVGDEVTRIGATDTG